MYRVENIEVFILTYNRSSFLTDSIKSILKQSIGKIKVTVMDNASTDNTEELVKNFQKTNDNLYYYRHAEHCSALQNVQKAISLATKEYVLMFHDDDILHPEYLNYALQVINKYPKIGIISTLCKEYTNPTNDNWSPVNKDFCHIYSKKDFINYLYYEQKFAFPSTIYKSANLKMLNETLEQKLKQFGKILDKPFVVKMLQEDEQAIIFLDNNLLRYRIHSGQDTQSGGPAYDEIIAYNKYFKNFMQKDLNSYILFNLMNYKQLKGLYNWCNDRSLSFLNFVKKAVKDGAGCIFTKFIISPFSFLFLGISHFLRKIFKSRCKKETL